MNGDVLHDGIETHPDTPCPIEIVRLLRRKASGVH
jgi:hypothetical protein